ncbi:MAG: type I restriction-modification system subunit M [Methanosphaera sp.]|nr:type I restriction-modification system subunit M [Methanosphaera sp.]
MSNYETKLWQIANKLRGNMDANEFKNYMLGLIFYRYLSEKLEMNLNKDLENDEITFKEAYQDEEYKQYLEKEAIEELGYFIEPECLFSTIIENINQKKEVIPLLNKAFQMINDTSFNTESQKDFQNLFEDVDLDSSKLGATNQEKDKLISEILLEISEIDFELDNDNSDILGDAYEYLISQFASNAGKKAGEFYTPQEVSTVLARIVTMDKTRLKSVYDPTCGSGSLLLRVGKELTTDGKCNVSDFYGQELNQTTYNLARMNMILHGVKYNDFDIKQGDSLENPKHMGMKFDVVVANPPFSAKWSSDKSFLEDERFSGYPKLAPKSKADYAFIQHMLYHLNEEGTLAVILPHGALFRQAAEGLIRKYLIEKLNYLDAVIGLPENLFYGTSIPACILVFKKCRTNTDDILFIDASNDYEKVKTQNKLRPEDIDKIVDTLQRRRETEKYSHRATLEEIKENEYNLNIPRYVDTFEEEEPVNLEETRQKINEIDKKIEEIDKQLEPYYKELGLKGI